MTRFLLCNVGLVVPVVLVFLLEILEFVLQFPLLSLRHLTIVENLLVLGKTRIVVRQRLCLGELRLVAVLLVLLCPRMSLSFGLLTELCTLCHVDSQLHLHLVSYVFAHQVSVFIERHWDLFHLDLRLLRDPTEL